LDFTSLSSLLEQTDDNIQRHEQPLARAAIDDRIEKKLDLDRTGKARLKAQLGKINISEHDFAGAFLHFRNAGIHHNLLAARVATCYLNLALKFGDENLGSEIRNLEARQPDNPEISLVRGLFEISQFQDAQARNTFLSTTHSRLEHRSQITEAHRRLAELPLLNLSQKENGIALATSHLHLEKLRDMDPAHPHIATLEGLLALSEGDLDRAIAIFEQRGIVSTPYNMMAVLGTTVAHLQHEEPYKQKRGTEWIRQSLEKIKPGTVLTHYLQLRARTLHSDDKEHTPIPLMLQRGIEQGKTHLLYIFLLASLHPNYEAWPVILEQLETNSIPFAKESLEMILKDPAMLNSFERPLLLREMLCDEAPMRILELNF